MTAPLQPSEAFMLCRFTRMPYLFFTSNSVVCSFNACSTSFLRHASKLEELGKESLRALSITSSGEIVSWLSHDRVSLKEVVTEG